jgi:histidinol-phosphate phosphatase family protein
MKQAVILAGGQGTRLRERLGDLPKPMIPIGGRPLLEHQVELARRHGFLDLVLFVHHRAELIEEYFGHGTRWGVRTRFVREREPLGTAGAVLAGRDLLGDRFLVLYGDTMVNLDLQRLWSAHERAGAAATLVIHPNNHPLDSDLVEVDGSGRVTAFHNRPHAPEACHQNLVNAGLYALEKSALDRGDLVSRGGPLDFGADLFPALLRAGAVLHGYNSPEYLKDIGTPARYDRVCAEYENGTIARSSLETPQRAVFLDRDGTLVVDRDGLRSADEVRLLPGAAEAVSLLNLHGWRAVVVTNQPVIAKGWCSETELQRIHNRLEMLLGAEHAYLDRLYYCPHHPDKGFAGERVDLKIQCDCRKPAPGMVRRAAQELNLDLPHSWMVGDTTVDLQTAENAGLRSVLVRTGAAGADGKYPARAERTCADVLEAVKWILERGGVTAGPAASPSQPV